LGVIDKLMTKQNIAALVENMLSGDVISLSRLISLVENESPDVPEIKKLLFPHVHRCAYRIGITGLAGAGKSVLIDKLTAAMRSKGLTVGIIAVDPSSLITGGAVLGDRIRMQQHYLDKGVFIRSMGTRGTCGGLCKAVYDSIDLLDAYGKDIVIIETTGVGQTEIDIARLADTVIVVLVPTLGDSIQLMKAGLVEIADIVVINKADCTGAEHLALEVKNALGFSFKDTETPVLITEARNNLGIGELYQELEKRVEALSSYQKSELNDLGCKPKDCG
jgi:LAO/AO transport system kinase